MSGKKKTKIKDPNDVSKIVYITKSFNPDNKVKIREKKKSN
jgi:hypothetical protein